MNQYIIPANSKRSQLYFGIFRGIDLGILGIGIAITLITVFAIPGDTLWIMVLKLMPLGLCILLVMPIQNYHNVLVYIQEIINFLKSNNKLKWKGWCMSSGIYSEDNKQE